MDATTAVGTLVAERPSRARIFERAGIDYCCGGRLTLEQACRKKGLDPARILDQIAAAEAGGAPEPTWLEASLADLADHIEATHHAFVRSELPRLIALSRKVASVHGDRRPELREVAEIVDALDRELTAHMAEEENELFPMIRGLEHGAASAAGKSGGGAAIDRTIALRIQEHDEAGAFLHRLREITQDYAVPPDACGSHRALLDSLAEFEADMHRHVHKENSILFPRAAALDRR